MKPTIMGRVELSSTFYQHPYVEFVFIDRSTGEDYSVKLSCHDFEYIHEGEYKAFCRLCTKLWPEQKL